MGTAFRKISIATLFLSIAAVCSIPQAHAVPSFARQTSMACEAVYLQSLGP